MPPLETDHHIVPLPFIADILPQMLILCDTTRGRYITIYMAESSLPTDEFPYFPFEHFLNYMGKMRFKLVDEKTRYFTAERFCYLGAVDDWIGIGLPDRLEKLLKKYLDV